MTAVLRWLAPGEIETDISERVDNGSDPRFSLTAYAEECSIASSSIVVRDPDGDLHITGLNRFDVVEDDSIADDPYIWVGRFTNRVEKRGRYLTGPSRDIECTLEDMNNTVSRYILGLTEGANRPAEDHGDRIAWLFGTDVMFNITDDSLVIINSSVNMPAYDYTGMSPQQVIDDCARASGYQNFVWYNGVTDELGLVYARSDGDWLDSGLRLSNLPSEVDDSTTFYLGMDAGLEWDPSRIASHVFARGDGITTFEENDDTADLFGRTDKAMDFPTVRDGATLTTRTLRALANDLDTETVIVKGTVYLPSTHASMFKAGYRFLLHATHLSGFQDDFADLRLVMTTHELITPTLYRIEFEAEPTDPAPILCDSPTPSDTYPPANSETTPVGGVAYYIRAGMPDPVPGSSYSGDWHFGFMGTGGSPDFAGYLVGNGMLVAVVGAGTVTIHTAVSGGATTVPWSVGTGLSGLVVQGVYDSGTINAGDDLELVIETDGGTNCVHWVSLNFHGEAPVLIGNAGVDWVSSEV
jgi:hypothetical protein